MNRFLAAVLLAILSLGLSACGGGADPDVIEQGTAEGDDGGRDEAGAAEEQGQLVESGFGQDGQYVQAVVLVENTSDHGGQTVTVSVNFLAEDGSILATESQVDSFNFPGQTIASQVFTDLGSGRQEVASIEPTLLVEDDGTFEETDVDFGQVRGTNLRQEYGTWSADFQVENPLDGPLEAPAVRVACRDARGAIIGGGFDFPDLVPPGGAVVSRPSLTVTGKPAECTAYVGGPIY